MQQTYTSRLVEKLPRIADIVSFQFERPQGYKYQAGQWFVITFPHSPGEPYTHHFSHSNSPTEPLLEFTTRLRGTEFKNALDALPRGAEVDVEGPYGAFTLPVDLEQVAFIAGGIGITCVRSILRSLADKGASGGVPGTIVLLFANRFEDSIPFRDELEQLKARLPGLRVIHVISQPGDDWQGYRGHIDQEVLDRELPQPSSWTYYVSGPPTFGKSMQEELTARGVGSESIKVERFEGYE